MFTLASQLPQYVGDEQRLALPLPLLEQLVPETSSENTSQDEIQHHKNVTRKKPNCIQTIMTVGNRYQLTLPANDGGWIQALDLYTNTNMHCHIHPTKRFLDLSQLLSMKVDGIRQPQDIQGMGSEVAVFYPMAYGALHGYLKQQKSLSEMEAAAFFRQIIFIINNAHKRGIALRDLKLKKFVFTDIHRTTICLSDLEDAIPISGHNVGEDLLDNRHGCPAYVAPEMLQPGSYSGRAADMWSAGVILYTLLAGHYPFYDAKAPNLFMKIRTGHYQIPDHVSYMARSLICSLLSYDPGMRPSAEAVESHPWISNPPKFVEPLYSVYTKQHTEVDQIVPIHKLL